MCEEPYADVFGFMPGDTTSQWHKLPIRLDPHGMKYEIEGLHGIKIVEIKLNWPTKEQDLMSLKRIQVAKEKERLRLRNERIKQSRLVTKGRAQYIETNDDYYS